MDSRAIPLGCKYKFEPEDHELLVYLLCKSMGESLPSEGFITEVDLYRINDPGVLFETTPEKEKVVYVFTKLKKTVSNGKRVERSVSGNRTWKGVDGGKPVYDVEGRLVGEKKNFVLVNKMKTKLGYNMTEFSLDNDTLRNSRFKDYVVCRIKKKAKKSRSPKHDISPEEDGFVSVPTIEGSAMDHYQGHQYDEGNTIVPYQSQETLYPVSWCAIEGDLAASVSEEGYQQLDDSIALSQCQYQGEQEFYQFSESNEGLGNFMRMDCENIDSFQALINSGFFNFSEESWDMVSVS